MLGTVTGSAAMTNDQRGLAMQCGKSRNRSILCLNHRDEGRCTD